MDRRVWSAEADVVGGGATGVRGPNPMAVTFRRAASSSRQMVPLARLFAVVHLCVSVAHGASHAALGIWPGAADAVFIALAVYAAPAAAVALLPRRAARGRRRCPVEDPGLAPDGASGRLSALNRRRICRGQIARHRRGKAPGGGGVGEELAFRRDGETGARIR